MSLKLIAIGCLHGNLHKKTLNLIKSEKPDAVLISGDFSGGDFADKLRDYEKNLIEKFGPISQLWPMKVQIEADKNFRKWAKMSANNTTKIFRALKKIKTPVLYIQGNWDSVSSIDLHSEAGNFFIDSNSGSNMRYIHDKIVSVNGYSIIGFGGYRGTSLKEYLYKDLPQPWPDKEYILAVRDGMKNEMDKLFKKVKNKRKTILVTHDPPYNTFDYLKSAKKFYGEKVTREMIKKHSPLLCVCSHFHEHRGTKKIGKTLVTATGFGHNGQAAVINIDSEVKVKLVG